MCLCKVEFSFHLWTKTLLISGLLKNLINPHIERKMTFWEAVDPWSMWVLGVPTLHAAENPQIIYSHFLYILCVSLCIYYGSASDDSTNCLFCSIYCLKKICEVSLCISNLCCSRFNVLCPRLSTIFWLSPLCLSPDYQVEEW